MPYPSPNISHPEPPTEFPAPFLYPSISSLIPHRILLMALPSSSLSPFVLEGGSKVHLWRQGLTGAISIFSYPISIYIEGVVRVVLVVNKI
jgi:hypothetical protein